MSFLLVKNPDIPSQVLYRRDLAFTYTNSPNLELLETRMSKKMQHRSQAAELVRRHLRESAEVKRRVSDESLDSIVAAADLIADAFQAGGKLLLCGNGGSAADCQHLAAEFVSRLTKDFDRPGLPAVALTTDSSFLTAFANDCGFDGVFARQVEALGRPGDVLLGISTSGGSENVIRALQSARGKRMRTIAITGSGGPAVELADAPIAVPSDNTQYIQEAHLAIEHILCALVERQLFAGEVAGADQP